LGVTGSVAAYKTVGLVKALSRFAQVRVVLTDAGARMVSEKLLAKASGHPVGRTLFQGFKPIPANTPSGSHPLSFVPHIEYAKQSDLVLIAPASADFLAKMAYGLGDDLLSTLCLYATCPLWVAPAMNMHMWNHPAVVQNQKTLRDRGVRFLGPESGHLACGDVGDGRFVEPSEIVSEIRDVFAHRDGWKNKRVVVTAGGTQEPIDPVRVITNHSSGKMGYALAQAALNRGAKVTLISAPVKLAPLAGVKMLGVKTAAEMRIQTLKVLPTADLVIMAAAVADYRVAKPSALKIKKSQKTLSLQLRKNPDILAEILSKRKRGQLVVGFSAETDHLEKNAALKWKKKPVDFLIANQVGASGTAFGSDTNELLIFSKFNPKPIRLARDFKSRLAIKVMDLVEAGWKTEGF
jgi:phosphopantothenoylcysteine decarboxylase/phosphopantothenate--cysteine ligase